ncbi:MAG: hypothetical protein ACRDHZ_00405 [Ktedonobacteraceae bacterium]
MIFPDDYEDNQEYEYERPMPDMPHIWPAENCSICGKPGCTRGCVHCGKAVCINAENYMEGSTCGGWIMDWWSNGAYDPDEGNEFWCNTCKKEEYSEDDVSMEDWVMPTPTPSVSTGVQSSDQTHEFDPFFDPDELEKIVY